MIRCQIEMEQGQEEIVICGRLDIEEKKQDIGEAIVNKKEVKEVIEYV